MYLLSGDQEGWMLEYKSLVSFSALPVSKSYKYKSPTPSFKPVKTTYLPSGDHSGFEKEDTSFISINSVLPVSLSTMLSLFRPPLYTTKTNFLLSGDHVPPDSI